MKISLEEVRRVADLARIPFTEAELEPFAERMSQILDYVTKLDELDLGAVEPMAHVHDVVNAFRPDEVRPSLGQRNVLANAPAAETGCFRVKKVIGEGA